MCWHSSTSFFTLMIKFFFQMHHHSVNPLPFIYRGVAIFEKSQKGDQEFELSGISMGRYCLKCLAKSWGFGKNIKRGGWPWPCRGGLSIEGGVQNFCTLWTLNFRIIIILTTDWPKTILPIAHTTKNKVACNL